jgi:predicted transcriptional regulator
MPSTVTVQLDLDLEQRLTHLAHRLHQSKSILAVEAIRGFIEINEWQEKEIKSALQEADNEDFATEDEVTAVFEQWTHRSATHSSGH